MRNALKLPNGDILTIDNAGCLGELMHDAVHCPNDVVCYFTARTALLEQLCAGAIPHTIAMANFSGDAAWADYVRGIQRVYDEIDLPMPQLVGSSESNFTPVQSGVSLTMIGSQRFHVTMDCAHWYVVGQPLVGVDVLQNLEKCAPLRWLYEQLTLGRISYIHPLGSRGIRKECQKLFGRDVKVALPMDISAGPAAAVIVGSQQALAGFPYIEPIVF